jgi:hypothetical protein
MLLRPHLTSQQVQQLYIYIGQIKEKLYMTNKITLEKHMRKSMLFELQCFISPMIGTIQEHVQEVEILLSIGPIDTIKEMEIRLSEVTSLEISLRNLHKSWKTHLDVVKERFLNII